MGKMIDYDGPCLACGKPVTKYKTAKLCATHYNKLMGNNNGTYDEMAYKRYLKRTYNISLTEYNLLLDDQNGVCAICGIPPESQGKRLSVDHDHSCCPGNKSCGMCVRGLVCNACNLLLGYAKDSASTLAQAILYLEGRK